MCIRDRFVGAPSGQEYLAVTLVQRRVDVLDADGSVVSTDPVSYTHLRAHETVLDLVCRLLLEKKNENKDYTKSSTTRKKRTIDREHTHRKY